MKINGKQFGKCMLVTFGSIIALQIAGISSIPLSMAIGFLAGLAFPWLEAK